MLKSVKGGQRGHRYIEDASSKQAMSVFSVLMQYVKSFEYMSQADGEFSLDQWLEQGKGCIFVTNYSLVQDTLRPILSLFIDLLGKKLLSQKDDYYRRIFFFLDEFGTLQRLSTIVRLLTLSRSKGGSVWIGIQDIGQIDKLYTEALRQSIINACGNTVIFSVSDPKTGKFLSEKIGEISYINTDETFSMGVESSKDGLSLSRREKKESLVLSSEILNLKDLSCYVKLPNYDISKTELTYKHYDDRQEPLMIRDDLMLSAIKSSHRHEDFQDSTDDFIDGFDDTRDKDKKETLFIKDNEKPEGRENKDASCTKSSQDKRDNQEKNIVKDDASVKGDMQENKSAQKKEESIISLKEDDKSLSLEK